ncbi:MAG: hypothetical protein ACREF6_07205, partial [Alphaproteobacteria bacterium]
MHPIDRMIFTKMIRLLRSKRKGSDAPEDISSLMEMIEPTPPAREVPSAKAGDEAGEVGEVGGRAFFEPTLKVVSVDDLDESEVAAARSGAPHLNIRAAQESDEGVKPIHLEVHNTAIDRDASHAPHTHAKPRGADKGNGEWTAREAAKPAARRAGGAESNGAASAHHADAKNEEVKPKGGMLHTVPFRETRLARIDEDASSNPAFNIFANARMWRHDERNLNYSGEVAKLYRDVFTPTRPKRSYRDFSGRRDMIEAIIQAVEEERSHVILFGEKSLGKTSLLNIVAECAK